MTETRYRIERNDTREPASGWFDVDPVALCAELNMAAYRRGMGGLYGTYDNQGRRV